MEGGALEKQAPQWVLRRRLAPKRFSVDSTAGPALCARNIDLTRGSSSGLDSFLFPQSQDIGQPPCHPNHPRTATATMETLRSRERGLGDHSWEEEKSG